MTIKKNISFYLVSLFIFYQANGQTKLNSISFYVDYSYPMNKRLLVHKIDAVGGGAILTFNIYKYLHLNLTAGYSLFSLQQEKALEQWNWRFYSERYSAIVKDNLRADSSLAATLNPIQKMELNIFTLSFTYQYSLTKNIFIKPEFGAGIFFFTRRLYLEETWRKKFESIDYTFEYSYRNFASNKYGNPFAVFGGISITFQPSEIFSIGTSLNYYDFFRSIGKFGYDQFPINDYLNFKIILSFLY